MRRNHRIALGLVLSLPLLAPRAVLAVGETNGRIAGQILEDKTGTPIPQAKITVWSKALIGKQKSILTDDDGRYELVELPPGSYEVELSAEGAKPIKRRVVVQQGQLAPLNIKWSVELAEATKDVVVEEVHMTKPDTTQTGTVLTADSQSKVASGRRYQDIVQQVAGVSGDPSQGNPNVKGGMLLHNRYLVDGLDITDPVTNTFSSNINFDSIASVDVLTGGMEAQYNSMGGVINLITKAGSDTWSIDSSLYINNAKLSLPLQSGPNGYDGQLVFPKQKTANTQTYQANLNIGGPIVKTKLWFNFSFEYLYRENANSAGPPLDLQHPSRFDNRYLVRGKFTWAPSEKHRVTLSISGDPASFNNLNQNNYGLGLTEQHQDQGGAFGIVQWDYFVSKNVNTEVQAGFQYSRINNGPQGILGSVSSGDLASAPAGKFSAENGMYNPNQPQHTNNNDGTFWYQGGALVKDVRMNGQFDPSVSVRGELLGRHDAKFGLQTRFVDHTGYIHFPGGVSYSDLNDNGAGLEAGLCNDPSPVAGTPSGMTTGSSAGCFQRTLTPDYNQHQWGVGAGLFAQDKWKVTSRLMIMPGLRFDYGHTVNTVGQTVSSLWGFGPRLGMIVDVTGDQKTMFTAFYGRSNETLSLLTASNADIAGISATQQFNQSTQKWNALYQSGGAGGYLIDPNVTPPHADEVTVSFRRELVANSVGTIDYTYKRMSNIWDAVEVNQVWDPTGQRVVGYKNGMAQQVFLYTTPGANVRNYHGVDFIFESAPRQNLDFMVVYTLSFLYGAGAEQMGQLNGNAASQFYNPRQYNQFDGYLPEDRRHMLKVRASYNTHGLTVGANMQFITGAPLTKTFFNQTDGAYTTRRTPQGTEPSKLNDVTGIAEFRSQNLFTLDIRAQYDLFDLTHQHLSLIVDLFNAFNLQIPANNGISGTGAFQNQAIPTFGAVTSRQTPFQAQFGLRYQY